MVVNRKLSDEEVQQISCRIKSARMLTGLTQEHFADRNDISLTSLKCWELGRAVPRREGLENYLNAIKKHGIEVSFEWIFYGSGSGPTYIEGTQLSKRVPESDYLEQQIKLFQEHMLLKGLNPLVIKVSDDVMEPYFLPGDIVGGYYIALDKLLLENTPTSIHKSPWLIETGEAGFKLFFLFITEDSNQIFYRQSHTSPIKQLTASLVGRVCWHHRKVLYD